MITLNLIPPQKKEELRLKRTYLIIKNSIMVFLVFSIFIAAALLLIRMVLENQYHQIVSQTSLVLKTQSPIIYQIKKLNNQLSMVNDIQGDYLPLSDILIHLSKLSPPGIEFTSLKLNRPTKSMEIQGRADSRENFLDLKNNLENSNFFVKIVSPISNLLKEKNLDFRLEMNFNLERL